MKLCDGCRLPYKGTNFSANHNSKVRVHHGYIVVDYLTKVQISQQITTYQNRGSGCCPLSITLQRYKFLSKSQLIMVMFPVTLSCRLPYKGTNFSANHNNSLLMIVRALVVDYLTKVQISQQITTCPLCIILCSLLSITLQRYKFLSKSQQLVSRENLFNGCRLPYKGTNFSANHNFF